MDGSKDLSGLQLGDFNLNAIFPTSYIAYPLIVFTIPKKFIPGRRLYGILWNAKHVLMCGNQCPPMRKQKEARNQWTKRLTEWIEINHLPQEKLQGSWFVLFDQEYDTEAIPLFSDLVSDGWLIKA